MSAVNSCHLFFKSLCHALAEYPKATPTRIHVLQKRDVAHGALGAKARARGFVRLVPKTFEAICRIQSR